MPLLRHKILYHIANEPIWGPTFTSSDWFTHVFVIGHVTNGMQHASEIYASEGQIEAQSWMHKLIN